MEAEVQAQRAEFLSETRNWNPVVCHLDCSTTPTYSSYHFPATVMLTCCLFSLIRHLSRKLSITAVSHSLQQGRRFSCTEHFAICSGLGLTYLHRVFEKHPMYWSPTPNRGLAVLLKGRRGTCLGISTKTKNYTFFPVPGGFFIPTALPWLPSTGFKALLKKISVYIYKQGNCVEEKLIAESETVPQLPSPRPVPNTLGYTCLLGSCYGQLPLTAALVFLNVLGLF